MSQSKKASISFFSFIYEVKYDQHMVSYTHECVIDCVCYNHRSREHLSLSRMEMQ